MVRIMMGLIGWYEYTLGDAFAGIREGIMTTFADRHQHQRRASEALPVKLAFRDGFLFESELSI